MPSGISLLPANASYDYTERLIRRDWAWEFLRRNHVFREVQAHTAKSFNVKTHGTLSVITGNGHSRAELKKWGCVLVESPEARAPLAWVFWDPARCPEVVHMVAFEKNTDLDTAIFDLSDVHCQATLLSPPGDKQHLLFQDSGQSLQLVVSGADLGKPVHLLSETILPEDVMRHHLRGLQCFQHLQTTGHLLPDHCAIEPRMPRLRIVLQALDGSLAGASHREIAAAIFGAKRIDADWDDPGRHLQDHVRRAIRRGRELMEGGYLRLLG
jgi:hypothetical protein